MICTYTPSYDFPNCHKGWDITLGARPEGQIAWYGPENELVKDGTVTVGFSWLAWVPNDDLNGGMFDTFEEAQRDFEAKVFGGSE